jgi:hypothetical protein
MRRPPATVRGLEGLGRTRLSRHFFLRDFLMSEIGMIHGIPNVPTDPDRAIAHGRALCETLLDPLVDTFGHIAIRSGYRAPALNAFGNAQGFSCAANDNPIETHIWDHPNRAAACATIVIPWFADQYAIGRDWRDLAWWLHDHLPCSEIWFFPKLAAFNLTWRPVPLRRIGSYIAPKGLLLRDGALPTESADRRLARYSDFSPQKSVTYT